MRLSKEFIPTNTPSGVSLASPMASFLRVPLTWYRSATFAFFPDETNTMIHKVYTSPREQHAIRHFCGFCGTPLSYWSEEPRTEADFIQLTLGSLHREDLGDLEDLGLLSDSEGSSRAASPPTSADAVMTGGSPEQGELDRQVAIRGHREVFGGLPWFDSLIEGSRLGRRLGNVRASKGGGHSQDGTVRYEWEIVEYTEGDDDDDGNDTPRSGKRKLDDRDGGEMSSAMHHTVNA
jgi:hypothetical protein